MAKSTVPLRIAMVGLGCFIISLLVPTMALVKSQTLTVYSGLESNVLTMGLLSGAFGVNQYAFIGLVGVINISFFFTPFVLWWRVNQKLQIVLFVFVFVGFASSVFTLFAFVADALPLVLAAEHFKLLYGYFLWLIGYLLQLTAISYWLWHSGDLTLRSSGTAQKRAAP